MTVNLLGSALPASGTGRRTTDEQLVAVIRIDAVVQVALTLAQSTPQYRFKLVGLKTERKMRVELSSGEAATNRASNNNKSHHHTPSSTRQYEEMRFALG